MSRPTPDTSTVAAPRQIEIFAAGTHTQADGTTDAWPVSRLGAIAASYDPAVFEAPIVVGHPKMNAPAYGWVKGLAVEGGKLVGTVEQVNADFAAAVKGGAYKKISASFWLPEARGNPKPGHYYLRHVGFLGGHAPAVHGLKPAEFAADEADVVTFAELPLSRSTASFGAIEPWSLANAFEAVRRLFVTRRESVIAKEGIEAADKEVPSWDLESLANAAAKLREADMPAAVPSFAAPPTPNDAETDPKETSDHGGSDVLTAEQKAALEAEQAQLKADREAHDRRVAEFAAARTAQRRADQEAFVGGLIREGRVLPVEKDALLACFAGFGSDTADFAADSPEAKADAAFRKFLGGLPPRVPLKEVGAGSATAEFAGGGDAMAIAGRILDERKKAADRGESITDAEALARVKKGAVA